MTSDATLLKVSNTRRYTVAALVFLILLGWLVVNCFYAGYRQLSDLEQTTGQLHDATIQKTKGKNAFSYLAFSIATNSQVFGIRANQSEQPLTQLQQNMQLGARTTVYYASPSWWARPANFEVYQVEQVEREGSVMYSIEEVHNRALNHGAWALVAWFILAAITLGQYLQQRTLSVPES
jgi:hypothetical protein